MSSVSAVNSLLSGTSTSSTSSIDLSSLLQTATGASSVGIDVSAAVQAAIYADRAPERQWQAQQTSITSQITALSSIQTALASLTTDMNQLGDLSGSLASRTVSSSSYFVSATASAGAAIGQHSVAVQNLASTASWYSPVLGSSGAALDAGALTITSASGGQTSVATGAGVNSLSDLASAINASSAGVNASVVTDASGSRLALVSATSGSAADFSVTYTGSSGAADPDFSFTRATTGTNALLTVDGIPISSASNTVTGALAGITLSLTGTTATGSPASLQVAADSSTITQALSSFVSDYNTALSQVSSQFTYSASSSSQGPLSGNSDIRTLQSTLLAITGYSTGASGSSSVESLADLGITVGDDGSLSLDTSKLATALASPSAIQTFFQGSALDGFAQSFRQQIATYGDAGTGSISGEISNLNQQYSALGQQVTDYESGYIASQTTLLTAMYSKAEIALQQLPSQMQQIQAELGNNSSGNNG